MSDRKYKNIHLMDEKKQNTSDHKGQQLRFMSSCCFCRLGWLLVVLRINVDLAIFQPYLDLEAGDNQSLKNHVARPGIERFCRHW